MIYSKKHEFGALGEGRELCPLSLWCLALCVSFTWLLLGYVLSQYSSNRVSKLVSWVLWATVANESNSGWVCGNLWFIASWPGTQETTWTYDWHLKCGQSCGTEPLTSGLWHLFQADSGKIELNCSTPSGCLRTAYCGKQHMEGIIHSGLKLAFSLERSACFPISMGKSSSF